jgi:hypothetical protein
VVLEGSAEGVREAPYERSARPGRSPPVFG